MDGYFGSNRRLGERVDVEPVGAVLVIYRRPARGLLKDIRSRPFELDVRITDVSLSGGGVHGPYEPRVASGSIALLRVLGTESSVRVVRSDRTVVRGACRYGLEWRSLDPTFERQLHAAFDVLAVTDDLWFRYRPSGGGTGPLG